MSNNKQSSVEWLIDQLDDLQYNPLEKNGYENAKNRLREQAKAMGKKQCVDFALKCMFAHVIPSQATREVVEKLFDEGLQ